MNVLCILLLSICFPLIKKKFVSKLIYKLVYREPTTSIIYLLYFFPVMLVQNKTPLKIGLQSERSKGWGLKLVEGNGSLISDAPGIFVGEVDKTKPAGR